MPSSLERSPKESLSLYLGLGKSRKTTLALEDIGPEFVVVTSEVTHPKIEDLPYLEDNAPNFIQKAQRAEKERQAFCVMMMEDNPIVFEYLRNCDKPILLDDAAFINAELELKKPFKRFIRHIRHRKMRVLVTTHRAVDDLAPIAYFYATRIHQIGPLFDEGEARILFKRRTVNIDFQEFYARLKKMEIYDNTRRNYGESVYTIKSL